MRNRYPGKCYRCGEMVKAGEGHFERRKGVWLTQHASCAIEHRGATKGREDAVSEARAAKFFDRLS